MHQTVGNLVLPHVFHNVKLSSPGLGDGLVCYRPQLQTVALLSVIHNPYYNRNLSS